MRNECFVCEAQAASREAERFEGRTYTNYVCSAFPFLKKRKQKTRMADYRLSTKSISRGKGQSSVASAAYRAAVRMVDVQTGNVHDFTRKQGVIHSEVITPAHTPDWMQDRAQLWNAVEAIETRKNSRLAREIQLSLPHELNPAQRRDLVRDFVREQFVNQGMIADINIHAPDKGSDERNHHAHIMLTTRELTAEGFHEKKATPKARSWNEKTSLETWREAWALDQNRALEKHHQTARVDHRSYEARGIDKEPSRHRGYVSSSMEKKGERSRIGDENRDIAARNAERANTRAQLAQINALIARKQHLKDRLEQTRERLEATGARKLWRHLTGRTRSDEEAQRGLERAIERVRSHEEKLLEPQQREKRPYKPAEAPKAIQDRNVPKNKNKPPERITALYKQHSNPTDTPSNDEPAWKRRSSTLKDSFEEPAWKTRKYSSDDGFNRER